MVRFVNLLLILTATLFITSCSNTKIQKVWQSPSFSKKDLKTVLVIGVSASQVNRMVIEQTLIQRLEKKGIYAVSSTKAISDDYLNRKRIKAYTQKHHIAYVLIAYQSNQEVLKDFVRPETTTYENGSIPPTNDTELAFDFPAVDNFWSPNTFVTLQQRKHEEKTVKATLVTTLFQVSTGEKVWSAQTLTTDPDSISEVSDQLAKIILNNMK